MLSIWERVINVYFKKQVSISCGYLDIGHQQKLKRLDD